MPVLFDGDPFARGLGDCQPAVELMGIREYLGVLTSELLLSVYLSWAGGAAELIRHEPFAALQMDTSTRPK